MKKFMLVVTAFLAIGVSVALASTVAVYGPASAGYNQRFDRSFTTTAVGDVIVHAMWTAKAKQSYSLTVRHLTDPADKYSYDQICALTSTFGPTAGDWTCTVPAGETGAWLVEFFPTSGKVTDLVVTVTAET